MSEIAFYRLIRGTLEQVLPRLLEKVLESGRRAVVRCPTAERVEALDRVLWTYAPDSFLPHGTAADGFPDRQPIFLTRGTERPNGAEVLVLVEDAPDADLESYERVLVPFDGGDPAAVERARERWRVWRAAGHRLVHWQQEADGRWVKVRGG